MTQNSELLPCPFCGEHLTFEKDDATGKSWWVHSGDEKEGDDRCIMTNYMVFARRYSLDRWNRRASDKPSEAVAWADPREIAYVQRDGKAKVTLFDRRNPGNVTFPDVTMPLFVSPQRETEGREITEEMVRKAATEFLSHKGEQPWRVTRRGAELWEDYAPAMRAALAAALSVQERT